jgi:hypothetical protein
MLSLGRAFGRAAVPSELWERLNRIPAIQRWTEAHWARPMRERAFLETRDALLADPEEFLHGLGDAPQGRNSKRS